MTTQNLITIDNKKYDLTAFPSELQNLVALYQQWTVRQGAQQRELAITQYAIQSLGAEIGKQLAASNAQPVQETAPEAAEPSTIEPTQTKVKSTKTSSKK